MQIISNLLITASKYTRVGGNIALQTQALGASVVVTVKDDGIGMPADLVARVFDLFVRAERTPDRNSGGLGLGLALVKRLVELHGAESPWARAG